MDLSFVGEDYSKYAGFWQRFGAYWIDFGIWLPLNMILLYVGTISRLFNVYWCLPGLLLGLWFHVYLVGRYGGTPGKLLLKTRIAMEDGRPVTFLAAAIRFSVLFILTALMSVAMLIATLKMSDATFHELGLLQRSVALVALAPPWYRVVNILLQVWIWSEFVTLLFNRRRRAVHDFLAGTVVLRVQPAEAAAATPPLTAPEAGTAL